MESAADTAADQAQLAVFLFLQYLHPVKIIGIHGQSRKRRACQRRVKGGHGRSVIDQDGFVRLHVGECGLGDELFLLEMSAFLDAGFPQEGSSLLGEHSTAMCPAQITFRLQLGKIRADRRSADIEHITEFQYAETLFFF